MTLPSWCFPVAYAAGALWILVWECIAVWVRRKPGDTITELTARAIDVKVFWFLLAVFLLWVSLHLLSKGKLI